MQMPENIVVRQMEERDAISMALVESLCFADPWSVDAFERAFSDSNYLYYVAECDNRVIGMAGIIISPGEGYVTNVGVLPEFRGRNIAYCILESLVNSAKKKNITHLSLEVRVSNAKAISLYERLNFVNVGIRPRFYQHPQEDAFVFVFDY